MDGIDLVGHPLVSLVAEQNWSPDALAPSLAPLDLKPQRFEAGSEMRQYSVTRQARHLLGLDSFPRPKDDGDEIVDPGRWLRPTRIVEPLRILGHSPQRGSSQTPPAKPRRLDPYLEAVDLGAALAVLDWFRRAGRWLKGRFTRSDAPTTALAVVQEPHAFSYAIVGQEEGGGTSFSGAWRVTNRYQDRHATVVRADLRKPHRAEGYLSWQGLLIPSDEVPPRRTATLHVFFRVPHAEVGHGNPVKGVVLLTDNFGDRYRERVRFFPVTGA